jgi:FAD-dependent urate hydroxylase
MKSTTTIIGAGPYGLSVAAHACQLDGAEVRIFGKCMSFWENNMPVGMLLRSPWVASNLSDPKSTLSLDAYKAISGNNIAAPVPLDRFIGYGRWFQQRAVPAIDERTVRQVDSVAGKFRLTLEGGETLTSDRVIVAGGILPFAWKPVQFRDLSAQHASHASEHRDLRHFSGKRIVVVGGGQSALESAALLHEASAEVELIVRNPAVRFLHQRAWMHRWPVSSILYAWPDVGPALESHLNARPRLVRSLPRGFQDRLGRRAIRPAGASWLKPRVSGLKISTSRSIKSAIPSAGALRLTLDDGSERQVDHVLLATGYRVNISLYPFLSADLLKAIRQIDGYPQLGPGFETSVPGLHFVGAPAAWSYGPLMRFVAGADFASREVLAQITRTRRQS